MVSGSQRPNDPGRQLNSQSSTSSFSEMERTISRRHGETTALLDSNGESVTPRYGSATPSDLENDPKKDNTAFSKKVKYYIPSLAWIPDYNLSLLGGDFLAGITVASMLIPQSVSYATSLAKLSPPTGLFSASIPGIVYAFLGTSRQLNVAPEAALSLLLGQAITELRHDSPSQEPNDLDALGLGVATIITLQVGLISFLLGFFRLGFIDVILSRALLRGFITAVAVVIMVEQLIPMLGLVALQRIVQPETTLDKIFFIVDKALTKAHWHTTVISFTALSALVVLRYFKNFFKRYWWIYRLPEVLIVVAVSTLLSSQLHWDKEGVDILGAVSVSTGGSFIQFPIRSSNLKYLHRTTSTAVLISVVGFLDSIVAAKQNGTRFGHSISPNRELVALGAANLAGSFIPGTLPAYGSITRSRINGDVGGRTQMASLVCSAVILLATFFLLPWLYFLPKCVLASIICLVVFSLLVETPHDVAYYWRMGAWVDLALMSLTFIFSIIWNVEVGVVVSLIISLLLVVHRSSKTRMTILGRIPGTDRWKPINENPEAEENVPGALIIRIRENLDFANTAQLKERLRRLELYGVHKSHPSEDPRRQEASVLVFHMSDVEMCDASAAQIFFELLEEYKGRDVGLFITHLAPGPRETFNKAGIVKLLGADAFRESMAIYQIPSVALATELTTYDVLLGGGKTITTFMNQRYRRRRVKDITTKSTNYTCQVFFPNHICVSERFLGIFNVGVNYDDALHPYRTEGCPTTKHQWITILPNETDHFLQQGRNMTHSFDAHPPLLFPMCFYFNGGARLGTWVHLGCRCSVVIYREGCTLCVSWPVSRNE